MAAAGTTGGCQCGACRYEVSGPLPPVYACHCRECQRQSASAFGLSMPVPRAQLALTGELCVYSRPTDSGGISDCYFCPGCGVRLYHQSRGNPDFVSLKAGTLDDTTVLRPVAHIWVSRKQPWVELDPSVPAHATQPGNLSEWRRTLAGGGNAG
ncbi:MAG: GFA family protein [Sphingomonadales bacterium]